MQEASSGISVLALLVAVASLALSIASFRRTTWQRPRVKVRAVAQVRYKPDVHIILTVSLPNMSAAHVEARKLELKKYDGPGPMLDLELERTKLIEGPATNEIKAHTSENLVFRFDGFEDDDGRPYIGREALPYIKRRTHVFVSLSDGAIVTSRISAESGRPAE